GKRPYRSVMTLISAGAVVHAAPAAGSSAVPGSGLLLLLPKDSLVVQLVALWIIGEVPEAYLLVFGACQQGAGWIESDRPVWVAELEYRPEMPAVRVPQLDRMVFAAAG